MFRGVRDLGSSTRWSPRDGFLVKVALGIPASRKEEMAMAHIRCLWRVFLETHISLLFTSNWPGFSHTATSHCIRDWEMKSLFQVLVCPTKYQRHLLRRMWKVDTGEQLASSR